MRVLFLTSSYPRFPGDYAGLFVHDLARHLVRRGIAVTVLAPHEAGLSRAAIVDEVAVRRFVYAWPHRLQVLTYGDGVLANVCRCPLVLLLLVPYLASLWQAARRAVVECGVDLVHAHWWFPAGLVARQVSKEFGLPFVVTSYGSDVFALLRHRPLRWIATEIYRNAAAVTVLSTALRDTLHGYFPSLGSSQVIPTPVDLECCDQGTWPGRVVGAGDRDVLFVGRLTEQKGVHYLVRAFPEVLRHAGRARLVIVGDGPERDRLVETARALGIQGHVLFLGRQPHDQVLAWMASAAVVVAPGITGRSGEQEGLGVVLLEALASGKPVVATRTGGTSDVIRDGFTGLLVEEQDASGLAQAIGRLLADQELRRRLAEAGREHVAQAFGASVVAAQFKGVYREVLDHGSSTGWGGETTRRLDASS